MNALATRSTELRHKRAQLRRQIESGSNPIGRVIMRPPSYAEDIQIRYLLRSTPKIGRKTMNEICRRADVLPTELLSELSLTRRRRLVVAMSRNYLSVGADGRFTRR